MAVGDKGRGGKTVRLGGVRGGKMNFFVRSIFVVGQALVCTRGERCAEWEW